MTIMEITEVKRQLATNGYCIVENVLDEEEVHAALSAFQAWKNSSPQIAAIHSTVSPHGIFKHFEVGHQLHAWYVRTRTAVQDIFAGLWNTTSDNLAVSFDGTCWIPATWAKKNGCWTHTDQAPNKKGVACYQGFVALTTNKERTLVVYEGSHLLHEQYMKDHCLTHTKNWQRIDEEYLNSELLQLRRVLHVKAGSLVLWDSRTFHQNQYGVPGEERVVQYVCYLPRNNPGFSQRMQDKRKKYFEERRTTSHCPYPVHVNVTQPRSYGNEKLIINYDALQPPKLDHLIDDIQRIL